MAQALKTALLESEAAERRDAFRALLVSPLVTARDAAFEKIVRHRSEIAKRFHELTGWRVIIDVDAGFARLFKVPHRLHHDRAIETAHLTRQHPFERRRYELMCLALAALDEQTGQTTLQNIVRRIGEIALDDGLIAFDSARGHERRALTDVLLWFERRGILTSREGETERYVHDGARDALYDVNDRLVAAMISAPQSPTLAGDRIALMREVYPDSSEGARLRARHTVLRALLDDPVVYYEDVSAEGRQWLDATRAYVYDLLESQFGFDVERRAEGLAAIDESAVTTDVIFPDGGSTLKHAALLLAEQLGDKFRDRIITDNDVMDVVRAFIADHPSWSADVRDEGGGERLARGAMALLESFCLVQRVEGGWRMRAAIARMRPFTVPTTRSAENG